MERIIFLLVLGLLFGCNNHDIYLKDYPYFTNQIENTETNTYSLNNFSNLSEKNGVEFILSEYGRLMRVSQWKKNLRNGTTLIYSSTGVVFRLLSYVNDTLCGNYYELDTTSQRIVFVKYLEKIKTDIGIIDNQMIKFKNGKVDTNNGFYTSIHKNEDQGYKIKLCGHIAYEKIRIYIMESNEYKYIFNVKDFPCGVESKKNEVYYYKSKNKGLKYVIGILFNYQILDSGKEAGVYTYFKFEL